MNGAAELLIGEPMRPSKIIAPRWPAHRAIGPANRARCAPRVACCKAPAARLPLQGSCASPRARLALRHLSRDSLGYLSDFGEECAMAKVRVGLVGCGFVAELHIYAYRRVYGVDAQVTAVAARGDHVVDFARKHQIRTTYRDFASLLADKDIDVVDI